MPLHSRLRTIQYASAARSSQCLLLLLLRLIFPSPPSSTPYCGMAFLFPATDNLAAHPTTSKRKQLVNVPACASCPPRASCSQRAAVTLSCCIPRAGNLLISSSRLIPQHLQVPFALFGARCLSLPTFRDLICPASVSFFSLLLQE